MSDDLREAQAEVLRKVGRNVVLLQYLERLLKSLLDDRHISGYISELPAKHRQRRALIHKQTMGQLVSQYRDNATPNIDAEPTELEGAWISLTITIEGSQDEQEVLASLSEVVAERNELIHHFLPKWDMLSIDSGRAIEKQLDQQRDKILPVVTHLESLVQATQEIKKDLATVLANPEFLQQFLDRK
jgi:hypothetical protein